MESIQLDIHKDFIEASKRGERTAQYKLYQLYSKAMFNVGIRMMNNREEAEDVLQEAFTDAFRRLDSFRYESTFGAWLKRIVVNKCINHFNKKRIELLFFDELSGFDRKEDEEVDEEHLKFEVAKVKQAIEQLPSGGRTVLTLYLFEGYDHQEIAEILNITESTSKSQYMRAKRKVVELIENNTYKQ